MVLDPYKTAVGMHINVRPLIKDLENFLIRTENKNMLSYEYNEINDIKPIFITGRESLEQELPVWNHPLLINDARGNKYVVMDVRAYVRNEVTKGDFNNIKDVANNMSAIGLLVVRAIYMMLMYEDEASPIVPIKNTLAMGLAFWITTTLKSTLSLNIDETIKLEIIVVHYFLCSTTEETLDDDNVDNVYFRISNMLKLVRGNIKYIKETCDGLNHNPSDAVDLVDNIIKGCKSRTLDSLTTESLYNIMSSTWHGLNSTELVIMSIENIPTLITLMFNAASNKSFKNNRLSNIMLSKKRDLKLDEFSKRIETMIKENMHEM